MDYSFGTWVKRRRKALDLTQQQLAQQVGCSLSAVIKIEADERRPSRQLAELLAKQLDLPADQIPLFLKTARQEKTPDNLDVIPPLSGPVAAPALELNPGNLPVSPNPLVGREPELGAILHQLLDSTCRLLTLTGPGGIGKTRLATEAGRRLETQFVDGVYFISMAGVDMTASILSVIADTLGLTFSGPAAPIVQLVNFLRTRELLLVIDNMEHLLEGGTVLGELLQQTQHVKMLVTSREPLHLQWEWLFEVQGLPVPEEADVNLESNSALLLFVQRARQTSQNFSLKSEDVSALVRICKLVGGLPLAIELAASWVRILSCQEIANELEKSLDFLATRKLDVPQRHRSIKTVFEHSWLLLTEDERFFLKQLAVFQGGFTREAASSALGVPLAILSSLVDKSLLRYNKSPERYDFHELIRQYTFVQLQADPTEEAQASERYAAYYSGWIASLEKSFKSAQQPQTAQLIRAETCNWHYSWHWAVEQHRLDLLRKMLPCLNWYFEVYGYYDEALSDVKAAVDACRAKGAPSSLQQAEEKSIFALLVDALGWFEFRKGNVKAGAALLAESLEIARETEDPEVLYYVYGNWGYLSLMTGEISVASQLTTESLRYGQTLTPWHTAIPISVLGIVAYQQRNLSEARQQLTESLEIWRAVGDPRGLVFCMLYLGMTTFALQDIPATYAILQESNDIAARNHDRWAHAFGLDLLGMVAMAQGRAEEALANFQQSLALYNEIGDQLNGTQAIVHMGQAHTALQQLEEARRLFIHAYAQAQPAKWTPLLFNVLISYIEMCAELSASIKVAVALSVLTHSAATPNVRGRCEQIRETLTPRLTTEELEMAAQLAKDKQPEMWAQELIQ